MWNPFTRTEWMRGVSVNGLKPGDVVRHKVSLRRMVICDLWREGGAVVWAVVSDDVWKGDEYSIRVVELELAPPDPAVDPSADSTGKMTTRD